MEDQDSMVSTLGAEDLAMQKTRASAAMIVTQIPLNILVPAPEGLRIMKPFVSNNNLFVDFCSEMYPVLSIRIQALTKLGPHSSCNELEDAATLLCVLRSASNLAAAATHASWQKHRYTEQHSTVKLTFCR